jgi:hypothetical protein
MSIFSQPKPKTVDNIMSAFNQTIADLNEVTARELSVSEELTRQADLLKKQAEEAASEGARAETLATRLTALVSA